MGDSFCKKYKNPRTGNTSSGGAARNGRIKTLGGMDEIIKDTVSLATTTVTSILMDRADKPKKAK
jgi:hypothetical protein